MLLRPDLGLYVVADGVGGSKSGDVASRLACMSVANFYEASTAGEWPEDLGSLLDLTHPVAAQRLCAAVRKANRDIWAIASSREEHEKMNTTIVAAALAPAGDVLHVVHVGDSRCYGVRKQKMVRLTQDHSLRNEAKLQYPSITPERLARVPPNVITRALGRRETVEMDVRSVSARPGDRFILCSDGLTGMVSERRILEAILISETPREACDLLVSLANEAGGRDNISAVVLQF